VQKTLLLLFSKRLTKFVIEYTSIEKGFLDSIDLTKAGYQDSLNECYISIPKEEHLTHFFRLWENCHNLEFVMVNLICKGRIYPITKILMRNFKLKKAGMVAILKCDSQTAKKAYEEKEEDENEGYDFLAGFNELDLESTFNRISLS